MRSWRARPGSRSPRLPGATWTRRAQAYREWAEGQHRLRSDFPGGTLGLGDEEYAAAIKAAGEPQAAGTEFEDTRRLNAIREVLSHFDWEHDDRQLALEAIDRIADGGQA